MSAKVNLGIVAGELVSNLFSSLVQFDTELGLVPDLAENWTVSEDGLNYSFALRGDGQVATRRLRNSARPRE